METVAEEKSAPQLLFSEEMLEDKPNPFAVKALTATKVFAYSREDFVRSVKVRMQQRSASGSPGAKDFLNGQRRPASLRQRARTLMWSSSEPRRKPRLEEGNKETRRRKQRKAKTYIRKKNKANKRRERRIS
ncbi:hypothetical protein TGFOU_407150 [Toxoplasma gondii FOU]|uniref:Uncharacterized protein n=1 Tax=Toxoplasma gondii FOU TaxID=943167 RepID=A0A086JEQ0_TOXGO|nr:hypothetical protein TGFOU_407150 [Toxoplasma gondii FOU]